MYYYKMKRFPTSLDDLTKPKTGLRFMRKAYTDPVNGVDGSWRLIYVGPSGQLIGSLNQYTVGMTGTSLAGAGGPPQGGSSLTSSAGGQGFSGGANSSPFGSSQNGSNSQSRLGGTTANGTNSTNDDLSTNGAAPPSGFMDASNTIGGNIIGVGSKVNKKSFMVYQKAKNYRLFEFVWDPSKDMTVGGASAGIGTPVQNSNGFSNPAGTTSSSPFGQMGNPGQNPNPTPTPSPNPGNNPFQNQNPPLEGPSPNP
jgi:hypothetical protein